MAQSKNVGGTAFFLNSGPLLVPFGSPWPYYFVGLALPGARDLYKTQESVHGEKGRVNVQEEQRLQRLIRHIETLWGLNVSRKAPMGHYIYKMLDN